MNSIYSECAFKFSDGKGVTQQVLQISCIPALFQQLIYWLLTFAGIGALIFVIYGGIRFITSGGDPKQAEEARKTITFAIIGLVVILISFAILRFISDITGVKCITKFGFGC